MNIGRLIGKVAAKVIPASVIQQIVHAKAEELGQDFAAFAAATTAPNEPGFFGKVWCWTERNKKAVGSGFLLASAWAFVQGCPPVYGIQILPSWITCNTAQFLLFGMGCFLYGAGRLEADAFARLKQIAQGRAPDARVLRTGTTGQFPAVLSPTVPTVVIPVPPVPPKKG